MKNRLLLLSIVMAMLVSLLFDAAAPRSVSAEPGVNLALNKPAFSSGAEADIVSDDKAVDGSLDTRWSSDYLTQDPHPDTAWWYVDLEEPQTINQVVIHWAHPPAQTFQILVSNDAAVWTNVKGENAVIRNSSSTDSIVFATTQARYVKFQGIERTANEHGVYFGYAITEFEVLYDETLSEPDVNLALHRPVYSSGAEEDSVANEKAVDGSLGTRWSSNYLLQNPPPDSAWLYVDLGVAKSIQTVVLHWADAYAKSYQLLVSNDEINWTNVLGDGVTLSGRPGKAVVSFDLVTARYVRFQGVERSELNGGVKFGYAISEFEVYSNRIESNDEAQSIADGITALPDIVGGQTRLELPQAPDGYIIELFGSDRTQVLDLNGTIHPPLVDVEVQLLLQVRSELNPSQQALTSNIPVTVPGRHTQTADLNPEPKVIPSLREWLGRTGEFALTGTSRIAVSPADRDTLRQTAETLQSDYLDIASIELEIVYGEPRPGDIHLT